MNRSKSSTEFAGWLKRATVSSAFLYRLNIHLRLTLCFIFVILLMLVGNGVLLWQSHLIRAQADRLSGVDEELIEVLRVHTGLMSFYERLSDLARSEDSARLLRESGTLRAGLLDDAQRTQVVFNHLPGKVKLDPTVLPTLETIQRALPSYLDAIRMLAASGDWEAVRIRLEGQVQPLESLSSELVKDVAREVGEERKQAALSIARAERRMFLAVPITGFVTLLIAAGLGVAITRSITEPLGRLVEGSKALARGEFQHQVFVIGEDELAQLGRVFNETTGKLRDLYEALRVREEKLRQQEMELRQLLDLAPQHIFVEGPDGSCLYINKAALDYYGLTLEEWRSSDRSRIAYPGDWERMMSEAQSKFLSGLPHEAEVRLLRKDGKYRWFLFRRNPLRDEQGRITRWYVAATDIEDRKQAEERLENENVVLREEIDKVSMFEEIVGTSPALQTVLSRISKVAPTDSTVLITGETGTGKELIARAIHKRSKCSSRAFVSVNCAAIPRDLIASELFGHEKGAFTGATQRRLGRFELAEGGTILLDEVGELPAETQIALLRVLQEHEFERVGGNRPIQTDVRVIAATNRDLQAAMAAGTFRSDLFYRLNVFPIEIPPLRERREDISLLVEYFIDRYARKAGKQIRTVEKSTMELLRSYSWPGNIRELQNVVERSVIVGERENFSVDESWLSRQPPATEPRSPVDLSEKLAAQEKEIIEAALAKTGGKVSGASGAATMLGIRDSTLESKIRSLKINKFRFKTG